MPGADAKHETVTITLFSGIFYDRKQRYETETFKKTGYDPDRRNTCGRLLFLGAKLMHKSPAEIVEVSVDGKVVETLDLAKDQELTIDSVSGGTNHLIIKDGEAWVSEATCPDKICVHQGKIHLDGEIIVCLPNKMTAQIKSRK
mgnify:CR=1 FL=1